MRSANVLLLPTRGGTSGPQGGGGAGDPARPSLALGASCRPAPAFRARRLPPPSALQELETRARPTWGPSDAWGFWLPSTPSYLDAPKPGSPRTSLSEAPRPRAGVRVLSLFVSVSPSH